MRHLPTLALFAAAALLWYLGLSEDAVLVMAAAGTVELFAWKRLLKRRQSS
ncbi:hypothetical protein [Massilia niastensis]|uniref:hypothetical protein n=1 Tax=Massilia niastensis TaxID=544911 RepID=UPI00037027E5|nr:hypothetical protein [Massilia niastensis]